MITMPKREHSTHKPSKIISARLQKAFVACHAFCIILTAFYFRIVYLYYHIICLYATLSIVI